MSRHEILRIASFAFIAVGLVGLLAVEFMFDWGRPATLLFALSSVVGLSMLAYVALKERDQPTA